MRVVATAGHVDHGKSSLVLALTGTDPDRFPEEKARGLTIDIGFAFTELAELPGEVVGFVDVPGHVRFVKNMLAGVGAVEVAMLVIAANEGWMPQSEEHVRILELLDVRHGLVVVTKATLVDAETLELAQLEIADRLAGSTFATWPVVSCDSLSGAGLDAVRTTLAEVLAAAPPAADRGRARLWVDRVFAAKGAGTVVTGTLSGGALAVDDDVVVEPGGLRARVRGLESHHRRLDRVEPGSRVAVNLAGIDHTELTRGAAVVHPGQWISPSVVDVEIVGVDGQALPRRGELAAHVGSGEQRVRWRSFDADGRVGRVRFSAPVPLAPGDRIVLRSSGRRTTVGGAIVRDLEPPRRTADALARAELDTDALLLAQRDPLRIDDIGPLAGLDAEAALALVDRLLDSGAVQRVGDAITSSARLRATLDAAVERVHSFHASQPTERGIDLAVLASAVGRDTAYLRAAVDLDDRLLIDQDVVRERAHVGRASDDPEAQRWLAALAAAPFAPPTAAEVGVDKRIERALVKEGAVVDLDGVCFGAAAYADARRRLATLVLERGSYTVSDARDVLESSRKFVLAIVNALDREGVTRRRGDDRIPGPVAERAAATTSATDE